MWVVGRASVPRHVVLSIGILECPQDMATKFPRAGNPREKCLYKQAPSAFFLYVRRKELGPAHV